ncbi:glycosyltransferase [Luminiphilus sp.]|nr:glycosyltransferase [Luminiphilus sp.]
MTKKSPLEQGETVYLDSKIVFLSDGNLSKISESFLYQHFASRNPPYSMVGVNDLNQDDLDLSSRRLILIYKQLKASIKALMRSNRSDTIVVWLDFMGLLTYLFSRLLFCRRRILVLNLMIPAGTKSIFSVLRRFLYRMMLQDVNVFSTVNNIALVGYYKDVLKMNHFHRVFTLEDTILESAKEISGWSAGDGSVFFGGAAGRNHDLAIQIATLLPNIQFTFVVKKKQFNTSNELPQNVTVFRDIPIEEFEYHLSRASVMILPISTHTPAGILTLITAALKCRPVVSQNTLSLRPYINNGETGVLLDSSDASSWAAEINILLEDESKRHVMSEAFQKSIVKRCSVERYCSELDSIINIVSAGNK